MKIAPLAVMVLAVAPLAGQAENDGFVVYGIGGDDIGVGFVDVRGLYTWGGELGIMRGLYEDSPLLYHEAHVGLRISDRLFVSVFLGGFSSVFPVVLNEFPDNLKYLFLDRRGTGFLLDIGGGMAVGGKYTVMPAAPRSGRHRFSFMLAAHVRD